MQFDRYRPMATRALRSLAGPVRPGRDAEPARSRRAAPESVFSNTLRRQLHRCLIAAAAGLTSLAALQAPALAHPHVWVIVETEILYDKGLVTGVRHHWTFDEFYSAMAVEGLDANKDGKVDRAELAELAKVNIEGLTNYGYFTQVSLAGTPLPFGAPRDYWLEPVAPPPAEAASPPTPTRGASPAPSTAGTPASPPPPVLALSFTLPLAKPVFADAEGLKLRVSDPSFFIAFQYKPVRGVRFAAGAPANCRLILDAADARLGSLADAMRNALSPQETRDPTTDDPSALPPPEVQQRLTMGQQVGFGCR